MNIEWLNRNRRYVEALYFGALELARAPTAETHLELGLACCGAIRPVAMLNRMLYEPRTNGNATLDGGGLVVANGTPLVYEGYFHFIESLRRNPRIFLSGAVVHEDPRIVMSHELGTIVAEVLEDLAWYLRGEFHGFGGGLPYDLRSAAMGATLLLHRLGRSGAPLPAVVESNRTRLEEDIEQHLRRGPGAAFFDRK